MSKTAQSPRRQARSKGATRHQGRRKLWVTTSAGAAVIAGAATIIAAAVPGVFTMVDTRSGPGSPRSASPSVTPAPSQASLPHSRIPGDETTFIKDVTFPDNSIVTLRLRFIKKWELKNTGAVRWVGRYLIPDGLSTGNCSYPTRILVPATNPGRTVVISVLVTAASTPGLCYVTWKMTDASGALYFPGYVGIWFEVKVVKPISLPSATPSRRSGTTMDGAAATSRSAQSAGRARDLDGEH
jgi:hypothetical protein